MPESYCVNNQTSQKLRLMEARVDLVGTEWLTEVSLACIKKRLNYAMLAAPISPSFA